MTYTQRPTRYGTEEFVADLDDHKHLEAVILKRKRRRNITCKHCQVAHEELCTEFTPYIRSKEKWGDTPIIQMHPKNFDKANYYDTFEEAVDVTEILIPLVVKKLKLLGK